MNYAFARTLALLLSASVAAQDIRTERFAVHRSAGLATFDEGRLHGGGLAYAVGFEAGGMRFEPALGRAAPTTQHLTLTPVAVGRESSAAATLPSFVPPRRLGRTAIYEHSSSVRERYLVGVDGVEISWVFEQRLAGRGDLVVRYAVDTGMAGPQAIDGGGLGFGLHGIGGVTIGGVTGRDANGVEASGELAWVDGFLEMSLPASFVEGAAYPLVLDPLVGTAFDIWGGTNYNDTDPDCSFESTEGRYLVTFTRTFASNDVRLRGQIVIPGVGLFQGVIWLAGSPFLPPFVAGRARVASFSRLSRWGVVWTEDVGTVTLAYFRSVMSVDGSMSSLTSIATSAPGTIEGLDIGSEGGSYQQEPAFVAVWDDTNDNRIYARRIGYNLTGGTVLGPGYTVFADTLFTDYSQPAIARAAASGEKLMVVAKRYSGIGQTDGVRCALLSASDDTVTNSMTVHNSAGISVSSPEVDGFGSNWVVTWSQSNTGSSLPKVSRRAASLNGASLQFGSIESIGGSAFGWADHPTVGYSPGKTWLGYRYSSFGNYYLRALGVDSSTCLSCADSFSELVTNFLGPATRIVVATTASGHNLHVAPDEGIIIWNENLDIWAQEISNHGNGGTAVNMGGGCGNGGMQNADPPAAGESLVHNSVTNLPATALLTVFNLAGAAPPVTCGACSWLPFAFTAVLPVSSFQSASLQYTVPCKPSLVGVQFETQWTTFDPGAAPCAIAPSFSLTDRYLHTIGQ